MDTPATYLQAEELESWVRRLLESHGVSTESAAATAESLVDADLRGISTHGVVRIPLYVKRITLNLINRTPVPAFKPIGSAAERLDGDNGLGQWVGLEAIRRACALAQTNGIGMVLATHSNHFGTAGWFARKASERGFAALIWSQSESLVVPFGGTTRFFGTNPFCASMPRAADSPIVLDMATSAVPLGKIEVAKVESGTIPSDWAVDADGMPTTDPHAVYALQPMAGPKGSGLAMLIDLLSGALAGAACGPRIRRMYDDFEHEHNLAHTFIAIDAGRFAEGSKTDEAVETMVNDLRSQRPLDGAGGVFLPGEIEETKHAQNLKMGIKIPQTLRDNLIKLGEGTGVYFPA